MISITIVCTGDFPMKNFKRARGHGNPFQLSLLTAAIAGIASGAITKGPESKCTENWKFIKTQVKWVFS